MYDTSGSYSVCYAAPPDANLERRLSWLRAEIAREEVGARPAPRCDEGRSSLAARERLAPAPSDGLSTEEAYAWFGTMLGLLPPLAIFSRWFASVPYRDFDAALFWVLVCVSMNAVCCLVGRKFAAYLGRKVDDPARWSWPVHVFCSLLLGAVWGLVTGGAGGAVAFGFGAIFGVICAIPVALAAFPVFAVLHRLQSRGGMIDPRRLWPLALGVPACAAALILGF